MNSHIIRVLLPLYMASLIKSLVSTYATQGSRQLFWVYIWKTCQTLYKANFLASVFTLTKSDWNSMKYPPRLHTRQVQE